VPDLVDAGQRRRVRGRRAAAQKAREGDRRQKSNAPTH
jgi:hypothetical protein